MLTRLLAANLAVFAAALAATWLLTPVAAKIARRYGAMAEPNERSMHVKPVPYLGGLAMYVGLLVAVLVAFLIPVLRPAVTNGTETIAVLLAATIVVIVMTIDDMRDISPPAKIAGLVLAGSVLAIFGVGFSYFRVPFLENDFLLLSSDVAPLVVVVWVVVLCNAMNLIDGLDGLAAGVAAIAAAALFLFGLRLQDQGLLPLNSLGPVICSATAGLSLGFLRWNFHPAKIFMGDAGAMLLGLLLAASTMLIGGRVDDAFSGQTFFFFAPLVIPIIILGIPLADVILSVVRRLARGQSWTTADREHLHHRLLNMGHGPRRAVMLIYAWTILLSLVVLVPTYTGRGNAIVPFAVIGLALVLYAIFHPGNPKLARTPDAHGGKHARSRHPDESEKTAPEAPGRVPALVVGSGDAASAPGTREEPTLETFETRSSQDGIENPPIG